MQAQANYLENYLKILIMILIYMEHQKRVIPTSISK